MNNGKKSTTRYEAIKQYMDRLNPSITTLVVRAPKNAGNLAYRDVSNLHEEDDEDGRWIVFESKDISSGKPILVKTMGDIIHSETLLSKKRKDSRTITVSQICEMFSEIKKKKQNADYCEIILYVKDTGPMVFRNVKNFRKDKTKGTIWYFFDSHDSSSGVKSTIETQGRIIHSEQFI